jgi:hypothetical protein
VTLLNPRLPVARMLDLLRVDELFSIRQGDSHPVRSANQGSERAGLHARHRRPARPARLFRPGSCGRGA